jgi:2-keto-4-pentenoate hydratase/2-oxohepta-3-ene-1,7-dioic acid hydratase in catechol pathway
MKLASFSIGPKRSFGAVVTDAQGAIGVVDLGARMGAQVDVSTILADGRLPEVLDLAAQVEAQGADHMLSAVQLDIPVPRPGKIFCIGVNYGGRNAEYVDGTDAPVHPSVFVRFASSFVGHGQPLTRPPESAELDYEGEIVAVIGTAGRRISQDTARSHIAGLTVGNEGTIRDWVRHGKFNVTQGKNWDGSGAIGPWMVPISEVPAFDTLEVTTTVNGEVRQHDSVSSMAFPIEMQIAYLSTFCTLQPGDLIFTGTPTGSGARMSPPQFLKPGDVVEVHVPGIGTLHNGVQDEPTPQ